MADIMQQSLVFCENSEISGENTISQTSFDDFKRDLLDQGGNLATKQLNAWLARKTWDAEYPDIQNFVLQTNHSTLYKLTLDDLERIQNGSAEERTGHALGDVHGREPAVIETASFQTPWALIYLFHGLMERMGKIPRWEDFERFIYGAAKLRYWEKFKRFYNWEDCSVERKEFLTRGFRYRIGNAYYSCIRELDTITRLRVEHGLQVRYHLLADVHFKIDFWVKNVLVAVYVKNPKYRQDNLGRKVRVEGRLDLKNFKVLELNLKKAEAISYEPRPMLIDRNEIKKAAFEIKGLLCKD